MDLPQLGVPQPAYYDPVVPATAVGEKVKLQL